MAISIDRQDKALGKYYRQLAELKKSGVTHEGGTRHAFSGLLRELGKRRKLDLREEHAIHLPGASHPIRVDGALVDDFKRPFAYWEAKDSSDNLDNEISKKFDKGYPNNNIIFEDNIRAVLYQDGYRVRSTLISQKTDFAELLSQYLSYRAESFDSFNQAAESYGEEIRRIASDLKAKIDQAHEQNRAFQDAYDGLMSLCQSALNPNISREAVDEMLIQHLMTERIISKVFDLPSFSHINVIAVEIESVINALTSQHWNKAAFYGELEPFHKRVEDAAADLDHSQKQSFINSIYERFFQGYSVKVADTHGIVYTPHEIVDFMVRAVDDALQSDFGKQLGDPGIVVIDPATGTGNFIVQLLRHVSEYNRAQLEDFYADRLFANEVLLMPYYIASLNIEHTYYTEARLRKPFEGLCFVDTLDLPMRIAGEKPTQKQDMFISKKNARRIERQQAADINVIIGNPPYNVGQVNENDNNKNRKYDVIDKRIRETYAKDSNATLKNQLYDAYVRFWRWAVDRLGGRPGIVCYITNNSFVDAYAFDGFRKHMLQDFDEVYHLDLGGNLRKARPGQKISNVFDIRVGVGVTLAIRKD